MDIRRSGGDGTYYNATERALRSGVIRIKHSFGTQSKTGTVFVERILTTVMSLQQQKRNVLDYLTTVCQAVTQDIPAPSLLPTA
jgi:transposase